MSDYKLIAEPGKQEVIITRSFDAPRELVYEVFTNPELIPQWWGPRELTTQVERMEVRKGGIWRYIQHDAAGEEYAFSGVYHLVAPSEKLVFTFEFEPMAGHIILETTTFADQGGKTLVVDQSVFQSVADRDGMVNSGMERGSSESMERLTEILAKIAYVK
jgi:uncharacterized protein YndB with AHSA1/START domain